MAESSDRKELERRLEQAKRIAGLALDPLTKERLQRLVQELEEQLRLSEPGTADRRRARSHPTKALAEETTTRVALARRRAAALLVARTQLCDPAR